jgi:tetratricopeptide (TPR) repeat protein
MLAKAKLHAKRGENTQVRETLDTLLGTETVQTELKAEALFTMGDLYMKENNPAKAVPYFIQVYNMYGRWKPWVAKSYLQSAEALAKLNETDKARRTLQEMLTKTELEELPEFPLAKERLQSLGGPLPPAPADQTAPPTPAQG